MVKALHQERKRKIWIYFMDKLIETDLSFYDLAELYERDRFTLFNMVKDLVTRYLGRINNVRVYMTYFNPEELEAVIEYIVETENGETTVKIICSINPEKTLRDYYLYESKKRS